jgi:hypothetical protein
LRFFLDKAKPSKPQDLSRGYDPILVGFWGKGEGEREKKKPLTFTL